MFNLPFSRRSCLAAAVGGSCGAWLGAHSGKTHPNAPPRDLKIAGYAYDRVRAIQDGRVGIAGFDLQFHPEDIYSLNRQLFGPEQTYDVSETGLIPFVTRYANDGFRSYTLLPVFISRTFRHRNVFVRSDSGIEKPEDLRGRRVGTPGYGMSSHTWIRGFLQDIYGVRPEEMHWIETTKSSDGGKLNSGFSKYYFADDFPIEKGPPGVDESELLLSGKADALITAIEPRAMLDGDPRIRRLFPDVQAVEKEYFRSTGVFPIMHAVAIRKDVAEAHPELPKQLFGLYSESKQIAYEAMQSAEVLEITLPWINQAFQKTRDLMGDNFWSYGVKANRKELDLVMRYTHEQGLTKRRVKVEEVFHPSTLDLIEG